MQKKVRSTSHHKHLKNKLRQPKGAFNYRKASNRPVLNSHLIPHNFQDLNAFSRNHTNNLSHAQTHYSPKGFKNLGAFENEYSEDAESYHTNISQNFVKGMAHMPRLKRPRNGGNFSSNVQLNPNAYQMYRPNYPQGFNPNSQFYTYDQIEYENKQLEGKFNKKE